MKRGHWVALGAAVALTVWLVTRVIGGGQTGGFPAPEKQPVPDDDLHEYLNGHPDHPVVCGRADHHAGYTYTPHRYPRMTGGEITTLIHRGYSSMRIPNIADVQWMIAPPSEAVL